MGGNVTQERVHPVTPDNVFDQLSLKGRVVCVTGSSDGIGFAVAEAMAEAGANLALWYNSNDAVVSKGTKLAEQHRVVVKAYQVEVTSFPKVQEAVYAVEKDFGRIDVFVANAGIVISKPILEMSLEEYRKQMAVNVDGVVFCAKSVGTVFKRQRFGNFIITSSMSAHIVNIPIDEPVYCMTKAAVSHFGKSLAREWRDFARVNMVSPGYFHTKMAADPAAEEMAYHLAVLGRQGQVKELKGLYLYLASDASSFQTGSDVIIDGGYALP